MVWYALPLSASAGAHLPPLLVSTAFTASSFAVHLTDLTHIWSETLNRAAIVQRSREEGTSIDPSETGQLKIFLEKIKLGLAGGKGTTLALTINGDPDRPSLVLSLSVNLPGGLLPLHWPVRLSAAPQTLLTTQLTMPLLQTQHAHMQEMAGLMDVLKDKDHVIQKLLDKLEEQGTELGQIFPQVAGKVGRKVDRKKAEDKVRGIARFDVDTWKQGLSHEEPGDISKLIGEVFSAQTDTASTEISSAPEDQQILWEDIKGLTVQLDSGKISTKGPPKANKPKPQPPALKQDETQQEDDAFQTQATPPPATTASRVTSKSTKIDDSTDEDDEDLDGPSQRSTVPNSFPASPPPLSPKPTKKLGGLGKKKATRQPSPAPVANDSDDENSTADDTSTHKLSAAKQKTKSATPDPVPVPRRPQKKLGKLGGTKKGATTPKPEAEVDPEPQHSSTEDDEEAAGKDKEKEPSLSLPPAPHSKAKKGKLGSLGRKKNTAAASASVEPEPQPASSPPASTPPETQPGSNNTTPKRKLGGLRGNKKGKKEDGVKEEENSQRGRGSSPLDAGKEKTKTPEPRETSLERADRKREALKRELEEKAKAPVKKKRKF